MDLRKTIVPPNYHAERSLGDLFIAWCLVLPTPNHYPRARGNEQADLAVVALYIMQGVEIN